MIEMLRRRWESISARERRFIAALAVMLAIALYVWLLQSADRARVQLGTTVVALRWQANRLEQHAAEYGRLQAVPAATSSKTELRALVQAQAEASGLTSEKIRIDAVDANQVKVAVGAIAFADWLAWLSLLQSQHVRLGTCRIEALSATGLVSVTATLVRTRSQ